MRRLLSLVSSNCISCISPYSDLGRAIIILFNMIPTKYYHRLSHINDNRWNNQIWAKDHAHIDIRWHCAIESIGSAVKIDFILFFEIRQNWTLIISY